MGDTLSTGVAFRDQDITGSDYSLAETRLGYLNSVRQTVTQATSITTGVTLNTPFGTITVQAYNFGSFETVSFVLTNSNITANSKIILTKVENATTLTAYYRVQNVTNGAATIVITNFAGALSFSAFNINFIVLN